MRSKDTIQTVSAGSGDKKILFTSGKRSDGQFEKELIKYNKAQGRSVDDLIAQVEQSGKISYEGHLIFLRNAILKFDPKYKDPSLGINELQGLLYDLKIQIRDLQDILDCTKDPIPDTSCFVTTLQVEEPDGNRYIVNEGIQDKIADRYSKSITSLRQLCEIVEVRIKKQHDSATTHRLANNVNSVIKRAGSLREIFVSQDHYDRAVSSLVAAKILSDQRIYIAGRSEVSVFSFWIQILKDKGYVISSSYTFPLLASLIKSEFNLPSLNESSVRLKDPSTAINKFKRPISENL